MPLTWDVRDIADHETITSMPGDRGRWHPVTEALIWYSMICGFNQIETYNLDEVWRRISIWQRIDKPMLSNDEGEIPLRKADVEMHIGLATNASTLTTAQFRAKVVRYLNEHVDAGSKKQSAWDAIADRIHRHEIEQEEKAS